MKGEGVTQEYFKYLLSTENDRKGQLSKLKEEFEKFLIRSKSLGFLEFVENMKILNDMCFEEKWLLKTNWCEEVNSWLNHALGRNEPGLYVRPKDISRKLVDLYSRVRKTEGLLDKLKTSSPIKAYAKGRVNTYVRYQRGRNPELDNDVFVRFLWLKSDLDKAITEMLTEGEDYSVAIRLLGEIDNVDMEITKIENAK